MVIILRYIFFIFVFGGRCVCVGLLVDGDNKQHIHTILFLLKILVFFSSTSRV